LRWSSALRRAAGLIPPKENARLLRLGISGVRTKASPQGTGSLRMSEAYIPIPQGGRSDDRHSWAACTGRRTALSGAAVDPVLPGVAGPGGPTGDRPLGPAHRSRRGPARSGAVARVVCRPG